MSSMGYGTLSGGISGSLSEGGHQYFDANIFNNQNKIDYKNIFLNTGMDATASALGKTYKNLGELLELKPIINNSMDLGISQSFKPVIESHIGTINDTTEKKDK